MPVKMILSLDQRLLSQSLGNKGENLRRLKSKGFRIPKTFVCTWETYQAYLQSGECILEQLHSELEQVLSPQLAYAVRSSADVEDSVRYSFAGQFKTLLNVKGIDQVLSAIREVWDAASSDTVNAYLDRSQGTVGTLKMAVVIQEMIAPVISGVSFSRNPVTALDEVVVEAVAGSGILLVQDGVTPWRWVNKWGGWIEKPLQTSAPEELIAQVVETTRQIARAFKMDVDLEWVWDGSDLYWLQMRSITSTRTTPVYSHHIAKEMVPGLIKPLIWSTNVQISVSQVIRLIHEAFGECGLRPADLVRHFAYRVYFNMTTLSQVFERLGLPGESVEMMIGITPSTAGKAPMKPNVRLLPRLPRLFAFAISKWNISRKVARSLPQLKATVQKVTSSSLNELETVSLLAQLDQLNAAHREITYYNVIIPILTNLHQTLLKARLKRLGVEFDQLELASDSEGLHTSNPNTRLQILSQQYRQLDPNLQAKIASCTYAEFQQLRGIEEFQSSVAAFLDEFGYLSDNNNDFSVPPWRENPDLILRLITSYTRTETRDLHRISLQDIPAKGMNGWYLHTFYRRLRQFIAYRDAVSSMYSCDLSLFRRYYLALGKRLVEAGLLETAQDIFYLYDEEIRRSVRGEPVEIPLAELAGRRKAEIERSKDIVLPIVIYGDTLPPVVERVSQKLQGTPTSQGYYTGKVKIVRGLSDFYKVEQGDVLVIPYSDVGWAPLFAKAGGVIAESGGMLSHSSIIAREYGIPAVVSVYGALQLPENAIVSIDGYKGEIIVHAA